MGQGASAWSCSRRVAASGPTGITLSGRCKMAWRARCCLYGFAANELDVPKAIETCVVVVSKLLKERGLVIVSSGSERDRPCGVLRQGTRVVGCICMPEASDIFIKEFNHCYGQLRLEVSAPVPSPKSLDANPYTFRLPMWFRHVWHARNVDRMDE